MRLPPAFPLSRRNLLAFQWFVFKKLLSSPGVRTKIFDFEEGDSTEKLINSSRRLPHPVKAPDV